MVIEVQLLNYLLKSLQRVQSILKSSFAYLFILSFERKIKIVIILTFQFIQNGRNFGFMLAKFCNSSKWPLESKELRFST